MKITKKQMNDLEVIKWFVPKWCKSTRPGTPLLLKFDANGKSAEEAFLAYSDRGVPFDKMTCKEPFEFEMLLQGKRWRKIMCNEYEKGIHDGTSPWVSLLKDMPYSVAEYLGKEMFKGTKKGLVMEQWHLINGVPFVKMQEESPDTRLALACETLEGGVMTPSEEAPSNVQEESGTWAAHRFNKMRDANVKTIAEIAAYLRVRPDDELTYFDRFRREGYAKSPKEEADRQMRLIKKGKLLSRRDLIKVKNLYKSTI